LLITYHLLRSYDGNANAVFPRPVDAVNHGVRSPRDLEVLRR